MNPPSGTVCDFAILGAGALGSILGAHLARAGQSVVLLARERRARQIQADGLRITGLSEISIAVPTLCDPTALHAAKVLIVATKTPGTAEALGRLRHARIEMAFSVQNGTVKDELLAAVFGPARVLGCLADTSGELSANGSVVFTRNVNILLGELSGEPGQRAAGLARIIDSAGVRAAAVPNIRSLEWSKFAVWVGLVVLSVITREATWKYLSDPGSARVMVRLAREIGQLAGALGIPLTDQAVLPAASLCQGSEQQAMERVVAVGADFARNAPGHRMSSLQDIEAGRPLEIHETLGYALREGQRLGLALPLTDSCYQLLSALERMRPGNPG
ncbi:MAG TPA: 2-dehydropantoate 2-reductase [Steroidobacteraceae bacterium]|nr:2-dehydropantoate 2-reductase [Steroidobacteraceae bacterium]